MMRRILLIIGGLVLACVVFAVAVFGLAFVATNGAATAADAFMTALQNGDTDSAYAMFAPSLQDEVSSETFNETFGAANLESWSFTNRAVENNLGSVSGTAVIDGETFNVTVNLANNDGWKITGYDFAPQG
jgi:hypothetical protein